MSTLTSSCKEILPSLLILEGNWFYLNMGSLLRSQVPALILRWDLNPCPQGCWGHGCANGLRTHWLLFYFNWIEFLYWPVDPDPIRKLAIMTRLYFPFSAIFSTNLGTDLKLEWHWLYSYRPSRRKMAITLAI